MAIVPSGQKFHTVANDVETSNLGSKLANSNREIYTMQDVTDTVAAGLPAPTNPTSGIYPINKNGVFVDSGLSNSVTSLPPGPNNYLGLKFYDTFSGSTLLLLDPLNMGYTFGDASFVPGTSVSASGGISIQPAIGEMIMGCGISSPTNGVFRASGNTGIISMGTTPFTSIGISAYDQSLFIGSGLIGNIGPMDAITPVKWITVVDQNGNYYKSPLYQ